MRVLIDGDNCSKQQFIEKLARERRIPVVIYCTIDHQLSSNYATIKMNDGGTNRTDNLIYQDCQYNDIIITNDIGLASLCLLKVDSVITNYGKLLTKTNIDIELNMRNFIKSRIKKTKKYNIKQPKNTYNFGEAFIQAVINSENIEKSAI